MRPSRCPGRGGGSLAYLAAPRYALAEGASTLAGQLKDRQKMIILSRKIQPTRPCWPHGLLSLKRICTSALREGYGVKNRPAVAEKTNGLGRAFLQFPQRLFIA